MPKHLSNLYTHNESVTFSKKTGFNVLHIEGHVHERHKCDLLWKNQPLVIFYENRVLGMDQRRFYCRAQWSKSQALKSFLSRVMAKEIVHGSPVPQFTIFEKRSVLYVHSSTFMYTLCITPRGLHHNEFAWICWERWPQRECQYSSPGLTEKISREAMVSTLCKLSMIVLIAKAACNKHPWVWFNMKYFWQSTKESDTWDSHS